MRDQKTDELKRHIGQVSERRRWLGWFAFTIVPLCKSLASKAQSHFVSIFRFVCWFSEPIKLLSQKRDMLQVIFDCRLNIHSIMEAKFFRPPRDSFKCRVDAHKMLSTRNLICHFEINTVNLFSRDDVTAQKTVNQLGECYATKAGTWGNVWLNDPRRYQRAWAITVTSISK